MNMWVLELNDAEITLCRGTESAYREPGVALLTDTGVQFGDAALEQSRLHPRQAHNQFWQRLNAERVNPGAPNVDNQADLVYLQLMQIKEAGPIADGEDVVIAVPSNSTPEQLSLLLGIAQEAEVSISAIVDLSVAGSSTRPLPEKCKFIDVSLHRAVVAELDVTDVVRRGTVVEVPESGLTQLLGGWVDSVADRFVAETRFDPLRIAETEQQVFNQVYRIVASGAKDELAIELSHGGETRRIDVNTAQFAQKSQQRYEVLAQHIGAPTTLVVTHRITQLPGLVRMLEQRGHRLEWLPPGAVTEGIINQPTVSGANDDAIRFVTSMPSAGRAKEDPHLAVAVLATHLLCRANAMRIGDALNAADHPESVDMGTSGFRLVRRGSSVHVVPNGNDVTVNGRGLSAEAEIALGDVIKCGANEFALIRVNDG